MSLVVNFIYSEQYVFSYSNNALPMQMHLKV